MSDSDLTCDWCHCTFPADPRAFVESGFSVDVDESEAWRGVDLLDPTNAEEAKKEMGLNDEQLQELMATGSVSSGFSIVCLDCQQATLDNDRE